MVPQYVERFLPLSIILDLRSQLADLHLYANGSSLFTVLASARNCVRSPGNFFITLGRDLTSYSEFSADWDRSACLLSTLSAFRGPIVQRASTVVSVTVPTTGNMTLYVAQMLSSDASPLGLINSDGDSLPGTSVSYLSQNFTSILRDFTARKDISIDAPYCGASCEAVVQVFNQLINPIVPG